VTEAKLTAIKNTKKMVSRLQIIPTYVITVPQRHGWTDRQTDNIRSHYRALH